TFAAQFAAQIGTGSVRSLFTSPPGWLTSVVKGTDLSSSIWRVAADVVAVAWLATVLDEPATTIRFATAATPNIRMTMATRASMSVKPASRSGRGKDGWFIAIASALREDAAARGDRH